jgi:hypothetical protein
MELLMQQLNWKQTDFSQISGLHADERAQALCDNQIDAFVTSQDTLTVPSEKLRIVVM